MGGKAPACKKQETRYKKLFHFLYFIKNGKQKQLANSGMFLIKCRGNRKERNV
jgi:hypothetical protein